MNALNTTIIQQLEILESRIAFQDLTIEQLNQAIIVQQKQISQLQEQLRLLTEKLKATQPTLVASEAEETRPPHY